MKKQKIALIGMGFLGLPLAQMLIKLGSEVIATKTQPFQSNLPELIALPLSLSENALDLEIIKQINQSDLVIYNLPPLGPDWVEPFIERLSADRPVIYTSSISIYGPHRGDIDENFIVPHDSPYAPTVLKLEELFKSRFNQLTLLRLGGLYGNTSTHERHPINFLSGKTHLKNGDEFLHLVHVNDCINAITTVIKNNIFGIDINLISDLRISKKEYYSKIAEKLNLAPPQFDEVEILTPTKISNKKSHEILGIEYLNPLEYQRN